MLYSEACRVVVLVEAVSGLIGDNTADYNVRGGNEIAAELETISIAGEAFDTPKIKTVAEGNTVFNAHWMGCLPKVEPVIGVFPSPTATEDVARADLVLGTETICILPACWSIHVAVRVAIQDEIVAGRGSKIDAATLIIMRAAPFNGVVMAGDVDAAPR